jgi:hypothetical protein
LSLIQVDCHIDWIVDHKILVGPFLLCRQSPTLLVPDLDIGRFGLVSDSITDRFRSFLVASLRMLPVSAIFICIINNILGQICADISVTVTACVLSRPKMLFY